MIKKTREELDIQLERITNRLLKNLPSEADQELTQAVGVDPTLNYLSELSGDFIFHTELTEREYFTLAVLSWYLPEELGYLLNQSLFERWDAQKFMVEKELLLRSKTMMLSYLQIQDQFNDSDFFGNYFNDKKLQRVIKLIKLGKKDNRPVVKKVFRRGYSDHGSRRPDHQPEVRFPDFEKLITPNEYEALRISRLIERNKLHTRLLMNLRESS